MKNRIGLVVLGLSLASCANVSPAARVISTSETATAARRSEASGNPAIWGGRESAEPGLLGRGFVAGTTEAGGLILHDMQGSGVQRIAGPQLTDLDVTAMPLAESYSVVMGGPERTGSRTRIVLFRLDRGADQTVRPWGEIATDLSAPAGFCMRQNRGVVHAVIIDRRGETRQFAVTEGPTGELVAEEVRRFRISQSGRGCAIEAGGAGRIYFSHSREGVWRYPLIPSAVVEPVWLHASVPNGFPQGTGVSLLTDLEGSYLITQDRSGAAFSVWRPNSQDLTWLGRFDVREQGAGRAVRTVAGMDAYGAELALFPNGFVVVQDDANDGSPNMKYVDWGAVKRALGF